MVEGETAVWGRRKFYRHSPESAYVVFPPLGRLGYVIRGAKKSRVIVLGGPDFCGTLASSPSARLSRVVVDTESMLVLKSLRPINLAIVDTPVDGNVSP